MSATNKPILPKRKYPVSIRRSMRNETYQPIPGLRGKTMDSNDVPIRETATYTDSEKKVDEPCAEIPENSLDSTMSTTLNDSGFMDSSNSGRMKSESPCHTAPLHNTNKIPEHSLNTTMSTTLNESGFMDSSNSGRLESNSPCHTAPLQNTNKNDPPQVPSTNPPAKPAGPTKQTKIKCEHCGILMKGQKDVRSGYSDSNQVDLSTNSETLDSTWIPCDKCEKWAHAKCHNIEEFEMVLMDKYHCPPCTLLHGPTIMRPTVAPHRIKYNDPSQIYLPTEVGTRVWVEEFMKKEAELPAPGADDVVICSSGTEFTETFDYNSDWTKIYLMKSPQGLGLRMPPRDFCIDDLVECFGEGHLVDTIDVWRQETVSMSLGAFRRHLQKQNRTRLFNFLSLEFSDNVEMCSLISPPELVPQMSLVHRLWPDHVTKAHQKSKPEVARYCLCGMGGSYTDFHVDFGGSSVWYHIHKGQKIFYIVRPTANNLDAFERYQMSANRSETFFGDVIPAEEVKRVVIREGETLMLPSGWIHAVLTPVDSLVFGGNYLHHLNIPMQLRINDMEKRLAAEGLTDEKFLYPEFELVHWYAAHTFFNEQLKAATDEGRKADQWLMDAAAALIPHFKLWIERDQEKVDRSFVEIQQKLQARFNAQQKVRQPKVISRKRRGTKKNESSAEEDVYEPSHSRKTRSTGSAAVAKASPAPFSPKKLRSRSKVNSGP